MLIEQAVWIVRRHFTNWWRNLWISLSPGHSSRCWISQSRTWTPIMESLSLYLFTLWERNYWTHRLVDMVFLRKKLYTNWIYYQVVHVKHWTLLKYSCLNRESIDFSFFLLLQLHSMSINFQLFVFCWAPVGFLLNKIFDRFKNIKQWTF